MMSRYQTKTARLYQAGFTIDEALTRGANYSEFINLEEEFKGASIPVHLLHGFNKTKAYDCDYHTGGLKGLILRETIKSHNDAVLQSLRGE